MGEREGHKERGSPPLKPLFPCKPTTAEVYESVKLEEMDFHGE
jgi:hypothetical protein